MARHRDSYSKDRQGEEKKRGHKAGDALCIALADMEGEVFVLSDCCSVWLPVRLPPTIATLGATKAPREADTCNRYR